MNEFPIFISYRQTDGSDLARWLHDKLCGRTLPPTGEFLTAPATLSVYLDQTASATSDWKQLLEQELKRTQILTIVCSPGALYEFNDREDWFYHELNWWLNNRTTAPVLVAKSGLEPFWVPKIIRERWSDIQIVYVPPELFSPLASGEQEAAVNAIVQSILSGIVERLQSDDSCDLGLAKLPDTADMVNITGLYTWEKDRYFRYIRVNENYARAAGYESPQAMIGKSDDEMPWRSLADFFRIGDHQIMNALGSPRINVTEKEIMVDRVADILVTENQLLDRRRECIGITGYFVDITGYQLIRNNIAEPEKRKDIYLGKEFGNEYLCEVEVEIFKGILKSFSLEKIAELLNLERWAVEYHIKSIKRKLQCSTDGDLIAMAIRSGLPLTLFGLHEIK